MKKKLLSLSVLSLFNVTPVFAQQTVEEIQSQIDSLQALLDELPQDETNADSEVSNTDKADWGKRSTPVPLGEFIEIIDREYGHDEPFDVKLNLKINNIIRGQEAYDILISENRFNEPAPEGLEWAILELEVEYLEGSEDYPYSPRIRFDIFDTTGKQVDQVDTGTLSTKFRDTDIFPGVTHSGREVYLVPEGADFLLSTDLQKLYFFDSK